MRRGVRLAAGAALTVALFAGDVASFSLMPAGALAQARGYHGGGGGFHGGGFHGGGGFGGHEGFRGGYGGYGGYRGYGGYGYRGYGGYGYRGFGYGYGGYYGGFGFGDALLGAALIGGTAAIIASADRPYYEEYPPVGYPVYPPPVVVAPPAGYAPPPQPAYPSTDPVAQCSKAAVDEAGARGDSGRIVSIDRVDGFPNGANVTGMLEVRRADKAGSPERARFVCTSNFGQVTAFRFG